VFEKIDKKRREVKKMKKYLLLIAAFLLVLSMTNAAQAAPILASGENVIKFENYETLLNLDGSFATVGGVSIPTVTAGDLFAGIIRAQEIQLTNGTQVWDDINPPSGLDNLTGYFLTEVGSVDTTKNLITLKPSTLSDPFSRITTAERGAGVVMKLWADSSLSAWESDGVPPGIPGTGLADDISKATDGTLWSTLTMTGGYWWTDGPSVPPVTAGASVGTSWFGLNVLGGSGWQLLNDPNEDLFNSSVHVYGSSAIKTTGTHGEWMFASDDPAHLATPEPASMLLFGMGVLGLATSRLRRKKVA